VELFLTPREIRSSATQDRRYFSRDCAKPDASHSSGAARRVWSVLLCLRPDQDYSMNPIVIKFGGYQKPASINSPEGETDAPK
jgi:hypothetical protein